jgi:hypothetical protein
VSHPEWDLVWSSDALRDWVASGGAPSGFAWMQSVGTFWRSYRAAWSEASRVGEVPSGFHVMLMVIGVSTTVEYALTGLHENTIGRLSEWIGGHETPSDRVYAEEAAAYSALIHEAGWYRFAFWPYVGKVGCRLGHRWPAVALAGAKALSLGALVGEGGLCRAAHLGDGCGIQLPRA